MAKPIELSLVANANDLLKTTDSVDDALDKNLKSLYDLAKGSGKMSGEVEADFKDVVRATDKFGDALKDSERDVKGWGNVVSKESLNATDDFSKNNKKAATSAKESFSEIKNEARQNAAETFSSFDGSAQSLVSGVQGTLGGIVSSLGPIGALAGAAGAAGIGLISAAFDQAGEDADALAERTSNAFDDMIESGHRYLSDSLIAENLKDQLTGENLEKNRERAKQLGLSLGDVSAAFAGNSDAIKLVSERSEEYGKINQKRIDEGNQLGYVGKKAFDEISAGLDAVNKTTVDASTGASAFSQAISRWGIDADGSAAKVKGVGAAVQGLPDKVVKVSVDGTAAEVALRRLAAQKLQIEIEGIARNGKKLF